MKKLALALLIGLFAIGVVGGCASTNNLDDFWAYQLESGGDE